MARQITPCYLRKCVAYNLNTYNIAVVKPSQAYLFILVLWSYFYAITIIFSFELG